MTVPSRQTNPFATCWTDPQIAPLQIVDESTLEQLTAKLKTITRGGAIVGPHGAGKTTLARRLAERLQQAGWLVEWSELHAGERCPQTLDPPLAGPGRNTMLVVDGYEQLNCPQRWQVRRNCRRRGARLLVTSHRPTALPTLVRLAPDLNVALAIYRQLSREIPTGVTEEDVAKGFTTCGGNLRDLLFHLYDLHELRRRGGVEK